MILIPKKIYLLPAGLLVITGLIVYRVSTCPCNIDAGLFKEVYEQGEAAEKEVYAKQYEDELKHNLTFPLGEVDKVVVTKGYFSLDHTVKKEHVSQLIKLLNDTASYVWGEVGTFLPGKKLVFYDAANKPLGITNIDEDGTFTYSYPYLRRMKWGTLTQAANKELEQLIHK
jgi:hypothetical protein